MLLSTPPLLSTISSGGAAHLAQMVGLHLLPHLRLERGTLLKWTLPNKIARRVVATYQNFYLRTTGGPATDLARVMPDHRRVMTGRSPSVWNRACCHISTFRRSNSGSYWRADNRRCPMQILIISTVGQHIASLSIAYVPL